MSIMKLDTLTCTKVKSLNVLKTVYLPTSGSKDHVHKCGIKCFTLEPAF